MYLWYSSQRPPNTNARTTHVVGDLCSKVSRHLHVAECSRESPLAHPLYRTAMYRYRPALLTCVSLQAFIPAGAGAAATAELEPVPAPCPRT